MAGSPTVSIIPKAIGGLTVTLLQAIVTAHFLDVGETISVVVVQRFMGISAPPSSDTRQHTTSITTQTEECFQGTPDLSYRSALTLRNVP